MNRRRLVGLIVAATIVVSSRDVRGQEQPEFTKELARTATVGDYCTLAKKILASTEIMGAMGAREPAARERTDVICQPLFSQFTLLALAGGAPAPLEAVARIHSREFGETPMQIVGAMTVFNGITKDDSVRAFLPRALGADSTTWRNISEAAEALLVDAPALERVGNRLANYERKIGPSSARLNGAEVVLNYAAQLWLPVFRAHPLRGPSPLEIVASYAPGYITFDGNKTPLPVSGSEFGLRYYLFGKHFGKTGWQGVLLPSHFSVGMLTASDDNGAMVWPWRGHDRSGVFFAWGSVKVGYINRDRGSFLFTKQFQAVPLVF